MNRALLDSSVLDCMGSQKSETRRACVGILRHQIYIKQTSSNHGHMWYSAGQAKSTKNFEGFFFASEIVRNASENNLSHL